jgi:hypothetical protein
MDMRFVPLLVGLWFPFAMASRSLLSGVDLPFNIVFTYSALAWTLLAVVAITYKKTDNRGTSAIFNAANATI